MKYFGTDGIRGVVGESLTYDLAFRVGRAYGAYLTKDKKDNVKVLLARDTRISGPRFFEEVSKGLISMGVNVTLAGIMPTPAHTYLTKALDFDGGVMITASHNPSHHNGIKFCDAHGNKLTLDVQEWIEDQTDNFDEDNVSASKGSLTVDHSLAEIWQEFVINSLSKPDLTGYKIALDMANGAGYKLIPETFSYLGAQVLPYFTECDGENINKECGSLHVDNFAKTCVEIGADMGFSFDGDADRIMCVTANGTVLDGTDLMYIFGKYYKEKGMLTGNTVVSTIATNSGLGTSLKNIGINYVSTQVGGQYVHREMIEHDYKVGGEENGHMLLNDIGEGSDGMCIGLYLLKIMREKNCSALDLIEGFTRAKIAKADLHVTQAQKEAVKNGELDFVISDMQKLLGDSGRILVRTSGTECVVRILVEGPDQPLIDYICQTLTSATLVDISSD